MGSSYRSDLKDGRMKDWEKTLREAVEKVRTVISQVWDCVGSDGQYDNAAEDGGLAEKLSLACRFIEEELPEKS